MAGCDVVLRTLEMLLHAAQLGIASEVPSGKAKLMKTWEEVLRAAGLEEKVKIPRFSSIQTASGLRHLLAIANANISLFLFFSFSFSLFFSLFPFFFFSVDSNEKAP